MTYQSSDVSGNSVEIKKTDRITSVSGIPTDLYITGLVPRSEGARTRRRILSPIDIVVERFDKFNATTKKPEYLAAVTVKAQRTGSRSSRKQDENDTDQGPDSPKSDTAFLLNNSDTSQPFGIFEIRARDKYSGFQFAGRYSVDLVNETVTGGDIDGVPGISSESDTSLSPVFISLEEQFEGDGGNRVKVGDGMFRVSRGDVSLSELEDAEYFEITLDGTLQNRYQVWGGRILPARDHTYFWDVFLKRLKS